MRRFVLPAVAAWMICGTIGAAATDAATLRTTEVLTGPNGNWPPYIEIYTGTHQEPFEVAVFIINGFNSFHVSAVLEVVPPNNHQTLIIHRDEWEFPMSPAEERRYRDDQLNLGISAGGARAIVISEERTGITIATPHVSPDDHDWVDMFLYNINDAPVHDAWADEEIVHLDNYGDAILRAIEPGGGMITGPVNEHLVFVDNPEYRLKPGHEPSAQIGETVIPEPGAAALMGVMLTMLAVRRPRGTGRRRAVG